MTKTMHTEVPRIIRTRPGVWLMVALGATEVLNNNRNRKVTGICIRSVTTPILKVTRFQDSIRPERFLEEREVPWPLEITQQMKLT